ncbi:MAG: hypothetical protein LQ345_006202, partial [Seirophora villosa]
CAGEDNEDGEDRKDSELRVPNKPGACSQCIVKPASAGVPRRKIAAGFRRPSIS